MSQQDGQELGVGWALVWMAGVVVGVVLAILAGVPEHRQFSICCLHAKAGKKLGHPCALQEGTLSFLLPSSKPMSFQPSRGGLSSQSWNPGTRRPHMKLVSLTS